MKTRGVSLIEALVALAVMAFGMIGIAGMQSALRANADIARQRSEAVRIAEEAIERARAYSVVSTAAGKAAYADVASLGAAVVAGYVTNTQYTRTVTVNETAPQRFKSVAVDVDWTDRSNTAHRVTLTTVVHRTPPELAAALAIPGNDTVVQRPGGRNPAVPPGAVDQGDGTSTFTPPGAGSVAWVFDNSTGFIKFICLGGVCSASDARLVTGFVRFATAVAGPTPALAENPTDPPLAVSVSITQTLPAAVTPPDCFWGPFPEPPAVATAVEYFCVVRVLSPLFQWSGQALVGGLTLAASVSDASASAYRVCRYTPYRNNDAVGTRQPPPSGPALTNDDHPLLYSFVSGSLLNQNFLVIRAGNGSVAFDCPADDSATPRVNGNTWHHQPSS